MSNLNNLFRHHNSKQTPPKQRLFRASPSHEERSLPPYKSILKMNRKKSNGHGNERGEELGMLSREMNGVGLDRELNHYNKGVCLVLFRKLFFIVAGVFAVSAGTGLWGQQRILAHVLLASSRISCPLAYDWIGTIWYKIGSFIVNSLAYYANFMLLFTQLYPSPRPLPEFTVEVISAQAVLVLWLWQGLSQVLTGPILSTRSPYQGVVTRIWMVVKKLVKTITNLIVFSRILLFVGLIFYLFVIVLVIYYQKDRLFYSIFSWLVIKTSLQVNCLLVLALCLIEQVNEWASVDLLSSNRKHVQVTLLRLSSGERNDEAVRREIWRYIWSNCEDFWDTQFLSEGYRIQYDIIEDRLSMELKAIEQSCDKAARRIETKLSGSWWSRAKGNWEGWQIVRSLHQNKLLFFILQHVQHFETVSSTDHIRLDPFLKLRQRIGRSLEQMARDMRMKELRWPIERWRDYFFDEQKDE